MARLKQAHTPTQEHNSLEGAYDFFNRELFGKELPPCLITLQRKAMSYGYFSHGRFAGRGEEGRTDEIALNPEEFRGRSDREILSTLVHEMVHLWQAHFGKQPSGRYHDRQWADRMESVGLMPSDIGEPGGKRTGQSMTHYILTDGLFDRACGKLLERGFRLHWQSLPLAGSGKKKAPSSKVKFTCPECGQNVWGKPDTNVICGECEVPMAAAE